MPSLPLAIPDVLPHGRIRNGRRALMTTPRRGEVPLHLRAERWVVACRRFKIAMVAIVGTAIAAYCPPTPFASATEKRSRLGTHYPTEFCDSTVKCMWKGSSARSREPTTIEEDTKMLTSSINKLQFKLEADDSLRTPPD